MKTAMQELISELKRVEDYPMMPFVIRMATETNTINNTFMAR